MCTSFVCTTPYHLNFVDFQCHMGHCHRCITPGIPIKKTAGLGAKGTKVSVDFMTLTFEGYVRVKVKHSLYVACLSRRRHLIVGHSFMFSSA